MVRGSYRQFVTCIAIAAATLLAGCETLSMTALGIGGSAVVTQKLNGTPSRTFTLPLYMVRTASISALKRMGIEVKSDDGLKQIENREVIRASAGGREIEVELESITPQATRMRVVARNGGFFFYDGATATEIIVQTEKGLGV
jgi:hypothetical protein